MIVTAFVSVLAQVISLKLKFLVFQEYWKVVLTRERFLYRTSASLVR